MSAAVRRMQLKVPMRFTWMTRVNSSSFAGPDLPNGLHRGADAGAVDENVDAAEPVTGGLESRAHLVGVRDVRGGEDRALAHGFCGLGAGRCRAVEQCDGGPSREETFGGGAPEPRSASGHDGFHAAKFHWLLLGSHSSRSRPVRADPHYLVAVSRSFPHIFVLL